MRFIHWERILKQRIYFRDSGERDVIPNSIQLIAGRTGQLFNQSKKQKGVIFGKSVLCNGGTADHRQLRQNVRREQSQKLQLTFKATKENELGIA
jgi:hypothetical protein